MEPRLQEFQPLSLAYRSLTSCLPHGLCLCDLAPHSLLGRLSGHWSRHNAVTSFHTNYFIKGSDYTISNIKALDLGIWYPHLKQICALGLRTGDSGQYMFLAKPFFPTDLQLKGDLKKFLCSGPLSQVKSITFVYAACTGRSQETL